MARWPLPGTMEYAQDLASYDPVHYDVVRMHDHFAGTSDTTDTIELRPIRQRGDPSINRITQIYRGNRIILCDVVDDPVAVSLGNGPPANLQTLAPWAPLAFFTSCARFFAQRAETSSFGILARGSSSATCT